MNRGSSELVRSIASDKYVHAAISKGETHFSIAVRDLMKDLEGTGFPSNNYPQICTALRTKKFLRENSLEIEKVDGPPSGLSTTVVVHYRLTDTGLSTARKSTLSQSQNSPMETPAEKAKRLTDALRGLLKEELAEFGGTEAFIKWVRAEDETKADVGKAGTNA